MQKEVMTAIEEFEAELQAMEAKGLDPKEICRFYCKWRRLIKWLIKKIPEEWRKYVEKLPELIEELCKATGNPCETD